MSYILCPCAKAPLLHVLVDRPDTAHAAAGRPLSNLFSDAPEKRSSNKPLLPPPRPPPTPPSSTTMTPSTGAAAPSMPTRAAVVRQRACGLGARWPLLPHRPPFFRDAPPHLLRRPSWPVSPLRASGEKRRRDHERAPRRLPRVDFVGRSAASGLLRSGGRGESLGAGRPSAPLSCSSSH